MELFADFFYDKINILCVFYLRRDGMKMDRKKKICLAWLSLFWVFTGCCPAQRENSVPQYRVVTQIRIEYQNQTRRDVWNFYNENSIQVILAYLRHIDPYGRPKEDPEAVTGRTYQIQVFYSDGTQHLYEQRSDQYLRMDGGEWKRIDPATGLYLSGLLGMMPSENPLSQSDAAPPIVKPQI